MLKYLVEFDDIAKDNQVVVITGHSLGGALALIAACRLKIETGVSALMYTFGQPLVGFEDFAGRFPQEMPERLYRVINRQDIITAVPPTEIGYRHTGRPKRLSDDGIISSFRKYITLNNFMPRNAAVQSLDDFMYGRISRAEAEIKEQNISKRVGTTVLLDGDLPPVSEEEFIELQKDLRAIIERDRRSGAYVMKGSIVDGILGYIPWLNDHRIAEYINMMEKLNS